ncbi:MAG: hypothetical protein AUJ75_04705 [Candidatus Omnitrophica bacterium CG1_02_49_10]|nr:MAG: hypothetical protein AUJ75_04705 [Candidatus Omnitrophica bacterium CG1_02_49_10]
MMTPVRSFLCTAGDNSTNNRGLSVPKTAAFSHPTDYGTSDSPSYMAGYLPVRACLSRVRPPRARKDPYYPKCVR